MDHNLTEIRDRQIHRIQMERLLDQNRIGINSIEDGGHIHQQLRKDFPEILHITEEDKQRRQDQPHTKIKQNLANNGIQKKEELPRKRNAIKDTENEEHAKGQTKVDKGLHIF